MALIITISNAHNIAESENYKEPLQRSSTISSMNKYSSMRSTLVVVVAMFLIAFSNHQSATAQNNCTSITSDQFSSTRNQNCRQVINSARNGSTLDHKCCPAIRNLFNPPCLCSPGATLPVPNTLRDLVTKNCNGFTVPQELPRCPSPLEPCTPVLEIQIDEFDVACPASRDDQFDVPSNTTACCGRLSRRMNGATCLCSSRADGSLKASENLYRAASICNVTLSTVDIKLCRGYN